MKKGYKYRGGVGLLDINSNSIFIRDINTIVDNQIYLPTKSELNDPTEGFYNDDDIIKAFNINKNSSSGISKQYNSLTEKIKKVGIYSLSQNYDNELLWAYYANGHTGFTIEYDIDILKESLNHNQYFKVIYDFSVDYVLNIPKPNMSVFEKENTILMLKTYLGSKSLSWQHEKEYRLIVEGIGLFDIDYRSVTGIYFGCKMEEGEIDFIMEKLKGRGLSYYKMELIDKTYEFKPKKIDDKYSDTPQYIANCLEYNIDDLLLPKDLLGDEAYSYKQKLIEALEIVKLEPLIDEIYIATINISAGEPIFIIWAYTKSSPPPHKEFHFKLNCKGNVYRVK